MCEGLLEELVMRQIITTQDDVRLAATVHRSTAGDLGVAVFLPATGSRRQRYDAFAQFLAEQGWHAVTFDYRSIGESTLHGDEQHKASMRAWGERDLSAVIDWARSTFKPQRLILVAHSIGGQIIPLAANHNTVDAVLLIAAQKGHWRLWPAPEKYVVWAFFRLYIPLCLRLFGHVPLRFAGLDPLAGNVARDYARWTLKLPYYDDMENDLTPRFEEVQAPILALSFEDDTQYAPRAAVDFLLRHYYVNAPTWRSHIDPGRLGLQPLGHSGFFDAKTCPREYWTEAAEWLRVAADGAEDAYRFAALPDVERMADKCPLAPDSDGPAAQQAGVYSAVRDSV